MKWYKENKIEEEDCTFSYVSNYFGKLIVKELISNGANTFVTEENKTGKTFSNYRIYPKI